ncbi:hypothetical protein ABIE06_004213 [Pantoea dispersa]
MDTTTQQNAALVEESSAAASSLEGQALELEKTVAVFRLPPPSSMTMTSLPATINTLWNTAHQCQ